jgi:tetratricopeptide (TPR) repeat protein
VEALFKQGDIALKKKQFDLAEYFFQAAHNKDPENLKISLDEAALWHNYGKKHASSFCFIRGYQAYRLCFKDPLLSSHALFQALKLKIDEYETTKNFSAIFNALVLIQKLEKQNQPDFFEQYAQDKAKCVFYKAAYYKDAFLLKESLKLFIELYTQEKTCDNASFIADVYGELFHLLQDPTLLLQSILFRKEAMNLDSDNLKCLTSLAQDYKKLFFISFDESQIQNFHDICELASLIHPQNSSLFLMWAEGLIDLGIYADKLEWVKLGIEKSHEALACSSESTKVEFLIARGLAFVGQKLDKLCHIQESFEKIKSQEDDPTNYRLTLTLVDILEAYGHYYQDIDYFYQAIEKLQEALSTDNSIREFWLKMSKLYLEIANFDNTLLSYELSEKMVDKALLLYKCPESLILKGIILSKLGEIKQNNELIEQSLDYIEYGMNYYPSVFQPKVYHLFEYAKILDLCGAYNEDESSYMKALDVLAQIILLNPHYPNLHHQIALTQFHMAEFTENPELLKKSLLHYKMAAQTTDDDAIYVDWAIACLALSEMVETTHEALFLQHEASTKLKKALKHGQVQAYYFMACLCCVCKDFDKAITLLKIAERHEALPSPDDLIMDEWLSPLRNHEEFTKLVERQEMKRA